MKTIKKVAVTPVTPNTGDIIDSFNTTDDKHTNAPSINAVETKLNTIQTGTATTTSSTGSIDVTFKRSGNVVSVKAVLNMNENLDTVQIMGGISIPDFAKPTNTGAFVTGCIFGSYSIDTTNFKLHVNSIAKFSLIKLDNNNYTVIATGGDGTPQPTGENWIMFATYIVD